MFIALQKTENREVLDLLWRRIAWLAPRRLDDTITTPFGCEASLLSLAAPVAFTATTGEAR